MAVRQPLYEVALWADMLRVQDDEVFYAYMVDNQRSSSPKLSMPFARCPASCGTRTNQLPGRTRCSVSRRRSSEQGGRQRAYRRTRRRIRWRGNRAPPGASVARTHRRRFMPLTFDARFMGFSAGVAGAQSVFATFLYLRLRRLVPFAIAHALMDGASELIGVLLPKLRA
jgi:hypothetical protein